mgnify:CR=1 FL=1
MPSKSKKQHNLMAAVANNPKFAKKVGIPQSVGKDYVKADEGRKFRSGGMAGCGTKKMARGGMTKMARGGMAMGAGKGYKEGGKLPMVEKDGQKVPFYAADGKGKMARGGEVKMARGGMTKMARGGKVRGAGMAKKGVRPCKMV